MTFLHELSKGQKFSFFGACDRSGRYSPSKLKFRFSEKATKFEKNLCHPFDKRVVFCAGNSVLVKKLTKIFQNKCGQVVLYKL